METFEIVNSPEELAESMKKDGVVLEQEQPKFDLDFSGEQETAEPVQPIVEDTEETPQPIQEENQPYVEETFTAPSYSDQEVEQAIVNYLSERLGTQFESLDDLANFGQNQVDERIETIARFVQETGRPPEDWFRYQSLNPSEMDDMTAVRIQMAAEYPNLAYDEINMLISSKYKLNPDVYDENDVRLSTLQLKIDGQKARQSIDEIRSQYQAPVYDQSPEQLESFVDDNWIRTMYQEVDTFEGVEFDLGNGKSFKYGVDDNYRNYLKQKNANIDSYFDTYVKRDGTWDYDLMSSHMAVIDNIDSIVRSAYQQGLGDGQRNIVNKAANVSAATPQQKATTDSDPILDQISKIMGVNNTLTFKL
jgi:hypothetical protein